MKPNAEPAQPGRAASLHLADHNTPLIRDSWYIAAMGSEVSRTMMERTLLEESVLLYRKEDGTAVALQNRCPHRSFPLSRGSLKGDVVQCGYHGISFDSAGQCVRVPCGGIPANMRLRTYPLVERGPYLWIWPGRSQDADPSRIPDLQWLREDGKHAHVKGYFGVEANYVSLHENVMDMTHASYLHGIAGATENYATIAPRVTVENDVVHSTRSEQNTIPPAHYQAAMGRVGRHVDRYTQGWHFSPGVHTGSDTLTDLEAGPAERKVFEFGIMHAFTPASKTSTHYFWANGRDCNIDDEAVTEVMLARSKRVYYEDVEALQWVQHLRLSERPNEVSAASDQPSIQMRRIMARQALADSSRSDLHEESPRCGQ